jgi:hypothetical protein
MEPCRYCGKLTAWHRPRFGCLQQADPETWVYVCFDDLAKHKEDNRADYGSARKAQAVAAAW